ncbi:CYTH-like domain-containing protein [Scheffersomyces coipomensis]|uniref:CYTH-like domain-containing protein n=1 Tax=Scheffersomyces coipomensis TaxID=1788519 RepID=UPI00315D9359
MNVGSILNNDTPPSDHESESIQQPIGAVSVHNLNNNNINTVPHPINGHSTTSSSTTSSPYASKRNSIANITNDRDVDITTGRETTVNVSRNSSLSDSPKEDVDELTKLKALKRKTKPRRYNTPPIWAQRYIPPNQRHRYNNDVNINNNNNNNNNNNPDIQSNGNGNVKYKINDTPVFDYTTTRSLDLQVSITGVIPPSSFTRTVAEWIYANFSNITEENRKYVELELKFGKIMDKRTGNRINVDVVTECIYTNQSSTFFEMQVEEIAWNDIRKFFEELEKNYQDELRSGIPDLSKPRRKFNMLDSDITDTFYQVGNRGEQIKRVRVSKDNNLNPPRYTAIEKQRVADLFIHNPSSMYDLRLSLSLEMPVPENNIEPIRTKNKPSGVRDKKRNTWTHAPTLTQFDLTRVLIPREAKNKHGKTIINHDVNYEVELEIDTLEVFNAIDKIVAGTDAYRLEELVEIFINNARILNNRITKLASP